MGRFIYARIYEILDLKKNKFQQELDGILSISEIPQVKKKLNNYT